MIKEYIITGDGYYNSRVDSPISLEQIGDVEWKKGAIHFKGTEKQLEAFIDTLFEDETYFKYRDHFTKDEFNNLKRISIL